METESQIVSIGFDDMAFFSYLFFKAILWYSVHHNIDVSWNYSKQNQMSQ